MAISILTIQNKCNDERENFNLIAKICNSLGESFVFLI